MYNLYIFRVIISFSYIFRVFLFIGINVTDFFKRFKDMATDCGFSDNRKIQRV